MAENHRLSINVSGLPTLAAFSFTNENNQAMMTLFTIEMLKKGFLGFRQFKSSFAHTSDDISKYEKAVDDVFQKISITSIDELLSTPVAHSGLYRLTKE
jgi:glutamate-1-semialdehyde aminotransferase